MPAATTNYAWPSPRLADPPRQAPAARRAPAQACVRLASAPDAVARDSRAAELPPAARVSRAATASVRPAAAQVRRVAPARGERIGARRARCAIRLRPRACAPYAVRRVRPAARAIPAAAVAASTAVAWPTALAAAPARATPMVRVSPAAVRAVIPVSRAVRPAPSRPAPAARPMT